MGRHVGFVLQVADILAGYVALCDTETAFEHLHKHTFGSLLLSIQHELEDIDDLIGKYQPEVQS